MKKEKANVTRRYVPVSGSHLSKEDAKKIGQGIELLFEKHGHTPQFMRKFAEAVKSPKNPAHPVVKKKYEEIKNTAWRIAADYCVRNVDIIEISIAGEISPPQRATFILDLQDAPKKEVPEGERREIFTRDMVRNSPAALDAVEEDFRRGIRRSFAEFANVAGKTRALRVIREEFDSLRAPTAVAAD